VNIIMPAYNAEKTIEKTIQSIEKQTYQDYKIIVVDDGSTDRTEEIVKNYQELFKSKWQGRNSQDAGPVHTERESGIMYIKIKNSGQSNARNTALSFIEPNCQYVAYCDADDIWYPEHLEQMVMFLENNKEYALVCHRAKPVNEDGMELKSFGIPKFSGAGRFNKTVFEQGGNPVFISTVVHRPDVIKKSKGFLKALDCIEEWHMWWKISGMFNCYYLPLILTDYVVRGEGYAGKVTDEKKQLLQQHMDSNKCVGPEINFQFYGKTIEKPKEEIVSVLEEEPTPEPQREVTDVKMSLAEKIKNMSEEDAQMLMKLLG